MVTIKAKKIKKNGITSIVYKNGRKKEAEIEFRSNGKFMALCAFSGSSSLGFEYDDLTRAKEKTEVYLNNIHQFSEGANVLYV
jgi:antitoxin component YwqK of YwqJK toxin-antitoxin module